MPRTKKPQTTWITQEIFDQADSFMKAAEVINSVWMQDVNRHLQQDPTLLTKLFETGDSVQLNPPRHVLTQYPAIVLHVFALELYLKCLGTLVTGKKVSGHNVLSLFQNLPLKEQQLISGRLDAAPVSAFELLKDAQDAFEALRYAYELTPESQSGGSVGPLPTIVRSRILEFHPEWDKPF